MRLSFGIRGSLFLAVIAVLCSHIAVIAQDSVAHRWKPQVYGGISVGYSIDPSGSDFQTSDYFDHGVSPVGLRLMVGGHRFAMGITYGIQRVRWGTASGIGLGADVILNQGSGLQVGMTAGASLRRYTVGSSYADDGTAAQVGLFLRFGKNRLLRWRLEPSLQLFNLGNVRQNVITVALGMEIGSFTEQMASQSKAPPPAIDTDRMQRETPEKDTVRRHTLLGFVISDTYHRWSRMEAPYPSIQEPVDAYGLAIPEELGRWMLGVGINAEIAHRDFHELQVSYRSQERTGNLAYGAEGSGTSALTARYQYFRSVSRFGRTAHALLLGLSVEAMDRSATERTSYFVGDPDSRTVKSIECRSLLLSAAPRLLFSGKHVSFTITPHLGLLGRLEGKVRREYEVTTFHDVQLEYEWDERSFERSFTLSDLTKNKVLLGDIELGLIIWLWPPERK